MGKCQATPVPPPRDSKQLAQSRPQKGCVSETSQHPPPKLGCTRSSKNPHASPTRSHRRGEDRNIPYPTATTTADTITNDVPESLGGSAAPPFHPRALGSTEAGRSPGCTASAALSAAGSWFPRRPGVQNVKRNQRCFVVIVCGSKVSVDVGL